MPRYSREASKGQAALTADRLDMPGHPDFRLTRSRRDHRVEPARRGNQVIEENEAPRPHERSHHAGRVGSDRSRPVGVAGVRSVFDREAGEHEIDSRGAK